MVYFITKLPLVARKDTILVVYDRLCKMMHFVAITEGTLVEGLARLFRDNMWKLHGLPESIVLDRGPQFAVGIIRKLNKILGIETKLSTSFHLQTDGQTEQINQELEQYLWFFVDHRQNNWPEWLALVEFVVNNKVYLVAKVSPFMVNYGRELRMETDIRRKKSREDNRVYTKYKEGTREIRGNIKKSTEEDEKISRQEKKES